MPIPEKGSPKPDGIWTRRVKIRFGQCDPGGNVYTPNFFDLMNSTVETWFEEVLGFDYSSFSRERNTGLGYVHASADFARPATQGDTLDIAVFVQRLGATSLDLIFPFYNNGEEILRGRMVIVATSLSDHAKIPVPDDLRAAIEAKCKELPS